MKLFVGKSVFKKGSLYSSNVSFDEYVIVSLSIKEIYEDKNCNYYIKVMKKDSIDKDSLENMYFEKGCYDISNFECYFGESIEECKEDYINKCNNEIKEEKNKIENLENKIKNIKNI